MLFQTTAFAQYGNYGGGGGGSNNSYSPSLTETTDITTTIGINVPTTTGTGTVASGSQDTEIDESWIPARKAVLETVTFTTPYLVTKLPAGYASVQVRMDALLASVDAMPAAERQVKAVRLANAIQNFKTTVLRNNPRIRMILQYLQDRLVLIISVPSDSLDITYVDTTS